MISEEGIKIKWYKLGKACLQLGIAFNIGFLIFALLNKICEFHLLSQSSFWISRMDPFLRRSKS